MENITHVACVWGGFSEEQRTRLEVIQNELGHLSLTGLTTLVGNLTTPASLSKVSKPARDLLY